LGDFKNKKLLLKKSAGPDIETSGSSILEAGRRVS